MHDNVLDSGKLFCHRHGEGLFSAKHWGVPFVGITPDLPKQPRRNEPERYQSYFEASSLCGG
jgi:hypothetical protein